MVAIRNIRTCCRVLVVGGVLFGCDSQSDSQSVTVYPTERRGDGLVPLHAETFYPLVKLQDVFMYDGSGVLVSLTKDRGLACKVAGRRDWECSQCGTFARGWKCESYAMRRGEMSSQFYDVDPPKYVSWWRWRLLKLHEREG